MRRIDLPEGGWAEIRAPEDIKSVRLRRMMRSAATAVTPAMRKMPGDLPTDPEELELVDMGAIGLSYEEAEAMQRLQEITVVVFLVRWSRKEPLPTVDTIGNMDDDLFQALAKATQKDAAKYLLDDGTPDFDPNPVPEPGNPTGRDSGSTTPSSETEAPALSTPLS